MASKTINPTRMELTRLKGRLRTAVRGHRLLKDKRDELMRQFFLIVRENKELRAKVEQGIAEANRAMTVASSVMSPEMLQQALLYPKQSATLDMTFQNIMSVSVPVYEFHTKNEDAASIYPYGFAQTSGVRHSQFMHLYSRILQLFFRLYKITGICPKSGFIFQDDNRTERSCETGNPLSLFPGCR